MKVTTLLFFVILTVASFSFSAEESPVVGTYKGIIRNETLKRDQRADLDLIFDRKNGNELQISAVLKLHFGAESHGEYVSYVFDDVRYNVLTGSLVFDQADQELTILVSSFKNGHMEGQIRAPFLGLSNISLILDRKEKVAVKYPIIREISGVYRSKNGSVLQLQAYRSPDEKSEGGSSPFGENEIRGHLGRINANLGGLIVDSVFTQSSYDFYRGTLSLFGNLDPLVCKVDLTELNCDGEVFSRASVIVAEEPERPLSFWQTTNEPSPSDLPAPLSGQYWGYVHNEARDQYQLAGINIVSIPTAAEGTKLSAVATLHFGEIGTTESLIYKYEPRNFPLLSTQFVLKRNENDAIIQISYFKDGIIRGVWYSRCFGRVGTFEFRKENLRPLPSGKQLLPSLSGTRNADFWQVRLNIAPRPVVIHSANPFSPLAFGGYFWDSHKVVIPKSRIYGGSYDFYTGRVFLPVSITNEELYLSGIHRADGRLELFLHLSNRFGAVYCPQAIKFGSLSAPITPSPSPLNLETMCSNPFNGGPK